MTEEQKQTLIKDATYKKDLKISYFNSLNAAISLVSSWNFDNQELRIETIEKYKNHFINQFDEYYANRISITRAPYDKTAFPKKMKAAKNVDELKKTWLAASADERADKENLALCNKLKEKFFKNTKVVPPLESASA